MTHLVVHPEARLEARHAVAWYNMASPGLGIDLQTCFDESLVWLRELACPGSLVPGRMGKRGVRRLLVESFPYSVVFVRRGEEILVLAFAHHRRKPDYWRAHMK
jgi:hypothetical protein